MFRFFGGSIQKLKKIGSFKYSDESRRNHEDFSNNISNILNHELIIQEKLSVEATTLLECENYSKITDFLTPYNFENQSVQLMKIYTDERCDELSTFELDDITKLSRNKSIVLLISSKNGNKLSIFWKSRDIENFFILKHSDEATCKDYAKFYEFTADFLAESLSKGELGLCKVWKDHVNNNEVGAHLIADSRDHNLLLVAAEVGNVEIVKILMNVGASTVAEDGISAQDLAWKNRHSEVILALAQANLQYPDGIDINQLSDDFKMFYKATEELHSAIINKNEGKVKEILSFGHKMEFYFDLSNKSAARVAVDAKAFNIYEILLVNEIFLAPHEYQQGVFDDLEYAEQRIIRELHNKHSKDLPDKHINVLMTHSFISHDVPDAQGKLKYVYEAYKNMSKEPRLNTILKTVAASKNSRIIYDFNRDAVNIADPTTNESTEGVFYPMGIGYGIYIGARQLLDESTRSQAIGTLAHELCHYAVNLAFSNMANPYKSCDNETMKELNEISEKCKREKGKEEIVDLVHECYPTNKHHAELIVRPAHLIALYSDLPEKLAELDQIYPELFEFFDRIIEQMEAAISEIERREEKIVEKKDKKISKLKKSLKIVIVLATVFSIMSVGISIKLLKPEIYKKVSLEANKIFHFKTYIYNELSNNDKLAVQNASITYKNVNLQFHELFSNSSTAYTELKSDHILQILDGQDLNFNSSEYSYLNNLVHLDWQNLTWKLAQKASMSKFTYQNEKLHLYELGEVDPTILYSLSSNQIKDILDGKEQIIGNMVRNINDYIERKFEYEDCNKNSRRQKFLNLQSSFDDIVDSTNRNKILILSSGVGEGKTVTFKQLAIEIKKKYPQYWVSFIDLKEHTQIFDKYKKGIKSDDVENLLADILILKMKNNFEQEIFKKSYIKGKLVLLWNRFDEISPTFEKLLVDIMTNVNLFTNNTQYVCTAPLYASSLQSLFQMKAYELIPLTIDEQRQLLAAFFYSNNVQNGLERSFVDKVMNISQRLDINSPSMLKMIAKNLDESNFLESMNLFQIFNNFVDKKINNWQDKTKIGKNLSNPDLLETEQLDMSVIYQKFSLQSVIDHIFIHRLEIMQTKIPKTLQIEEISRMEILLIKNDMEFIFAHNTFVDFFIAKYFIENIYSVNGHLEDEEATHRLEVFFYVFKKYPRINIVAEFMKDFISQQPKDHIKIFHPAISELLSTKFKRFMFDLLDTLSPNVFDWMLMFFVKDHKVFTELVQLNEPETLCTATLNPVYRPTMIDFDNMMELSRKYFDEKEFQTFISGKNQKGVMILGLNYSNIFEEDKIQDAYKIFNDPVSEVLNFTESVKAGLTEEEQKELFAVLLNPRVYKNFNTFNLLSYYELWTSYIHNLTHSERRSDSEIKNLYGDVILNFIENFNNANFPGYEEILLFLINKIEKSLKHFEIHDMFVSRNLLQQATINKFIFENLWNCFVRNTFVKQRVEALKQNSSYGKFSFFNKSGFINQAYDFSNFTILHLSLISSQGDRRFFNYILNLYTTIFNELEAELQHFILRSNDLLLYAMRFCDKITARYFSNFLEKLFDKKEYDLMRLMERKIVGTELNAYLNMKRLKAGDPDVQAVFLKMYGNLKTRFYKSLQNK